MTWLPLFYWGYFVELCNLQFNISNVNISKILYAPLRLPSLLHCNTHKKVSLRLVPDMTLTLKKTTLPLEMGGSVHLPQPHSAMTMTLGLGSSYLGSYRELSSSLFTL